MNNSNIYNDIRTTDIYLSEDEKKEWKNRNILYNTLWFYLHVVGPEIEHSDFSVSKFQQAPPFDKWETVYHTNGGKVFIALTPKNSTSTPPKKLTADLMTGWWNPFKYFIGLNDADKSRSVLSRDLFSEDVFEKHKNDTENYWIVEWVKSKRRKNLKKENEEKIEEAVNAFVKFLEVVYTVGNTIPAPINWKIGKTLDGWDYKFECIKKAFYQEKKANFQETCWIEYINNYYDKNFETFIKQNHIVENGIPFWKKLKTEEFSNASPKEWKEYFKNATECINKRNKAIQDALSLKGDE